jgi:hypothetical protein
MTVSPVRRRLLTTAAAALGGLSGWAPLGVSAQEPTALEKIRKRGSLIVGLYHELPPFHVEG